MNSSGKNPKANTQTKKMPGKSETISKPKGKKGKQSLES